MIRLSDEVLPENRKEVNEYIGCVWAEVTMFARSIKWDKGTDDLRAQFQSHVAVEEARLQKNFEDIEYDIDSYDSVSLISGHGRIETVLSLAPHPRTQLTSNRLYSRCYTLSSREICRRSALPASMFYQITSSVTLWKQSSGSPLPLSIG